MPTASSLSISGVFAEGWRLTRRHWPWSVVTIFVAGLAADLVPQWLETSVFPSQQGPLFSLFTFAYVTAVYWAIAVGVLQAMLVAYDQKQPTFADFIQGARRSLALGLGVGIYLLLALLGLAALVVPGLILLGRLACGWVAMLDRGLGPIAGLKASWQLTKGRTGLTIVLILPSLVLLAVGIAAPHAFWVSVAMEVAFALNCSVVSFCQIHMYRQLDALQDARAPVTAA